MAASTTPIWSQETYLMMYNGSGYEQLVCIKSYPDLGGEPEQIQTTTLCEVKNHTYINGLQDTGSFEFTANYTKADYQKLLDAAAAGTQTYAVFFGSGRDTVIDSDNGAFYFEGELSCWPTGHGVNEAREITISISVASEVYFDEDPNA